MKPETDQILFKRKGQICQVYDGVQLRQKRKSSKCGNLVCGKDKSLRIEPLSHNAAETKTVERAVCRGSASDKEKFERKSGRGHKLHMGHAISVSNGFAGSSGIRADTGEPAGQGSVKGVKKQAKKMRNNLVDGGDHVALDNDCVEIFAENLTSREVGKSKGVQTECQLRYVHEELGHKEGKLYSEIISLGRLKKRRESDHGRMMQRVNVKTFGTADRDLNEMSPEEKRKAAALISQAKRSSLKMVLPQAAANRQRCENTRDVLNCSLLSSIDNDRGVRDIGNDYEIDRENEVIAEIDRGKEVIAEIDRENEVIAEINRGNEVIAGNGENGTEQTKREIDRKKNKETKIGHKMLDGSGKYYLGCVREHIKRKYRENTHGKTSGIVDKKRKTNTVLDRLYDCWNLDPMSVGLNKLTMPSVNKQNGKKSSRGIIVFLRVPVDSYSYLSYLKS